MKPIFLVIILSSYTCLLYKMAETLQRRNKVTSLNNSIEEFSNASEGRSSSGRWLPSFLTVVSFYNLPCVGKSHQGLPPRNGTCYTAKECKKRGGTSSGKCAWGFGACCVFTKTCGEMTSENCTYFTNPEYDWGSGYIPNSQETCALMVVKCQPDICQLRLDFEDLEIFGIDNGVCAVDSFTVVGGQRVPGLCGSNGGQHIYVNTPAGTDKITLQMNLDSLAIPGISNAFDRRWSIKITQIACNSPLQAPPGCLQYFTGRTGKITSFNFGTDVTQSTSGYPINQNYGVCIRKEAGYCSIRYTKNMQFQFGINPDDPDLAGYKGPDCGMFGNPGDYVIIPNAEPQNDRYCGGDFPAEGVETTAMPYVVTVVSDNIHFGEGGFMLDYRQQPC